MDSSITNNILLFEEDQVSSSISAVDSPAFLREHGVFYQANGDIGKLVAQLDNEGTSWEPNGLKKFLPTLQADPVSAIPSERAPLIYVRPAHPENTRSIQHRMSPCLLDFR